MTRGTKEFLLVAAAAAVGLAGGFVGVGPGLGSSGSGSSSAAGHSAKSPRGSGPSAAQGGRAAEAAAENVVDAEFLEWMRTASNEEMLAMVLDQFAEPSTGANFRSAILLRELFRRIPQEAYEYFVKHGPSHHNLMTAVFSSWASIAPQEAAEQAVKYSTSLGHHGWGGELSAPFRALGRADLEAALTLTAKLPQHRQRHAYEALLAGYASTAPSDMPRVLGLLKKKGVQPREGLTRWAMEDADGAIAWARANRKGISNDAAYLANGIGAKDPQRGLELYYELNGLEDGPNYSGVAASMLLRIMAEDFEVGVSWLEGKGSEERRQEVLKKAIDGMVKFQPELILDQLLAGDSTVMEHVKWNSLIGNLATRRSEDEMMALLEQAPEELRPRVRDALMGAGFIEATPEYLAEVLGSENGWKTSGTIRTLLLREPEKIGELLAQVQEEQRPRFLDDMADALANTHPGALLTVLQEVDTPGVFESRGAQYAVAALVGSQPEEAMRMVEQIPAGKGRDFGAQTIMANLMLDDAEGALRWLNGQRAAVSDDAIWHIATGMASRFPWEREGIDEMFGDLKPKPPAGGAEGGASVSGGIGVDFE